MNFIYQLGDRILRDKRRNRVNLKVKHIDFINYARKKKRDIQTPFLFLYYKLFTFPLNIERIL